MTITADINLLTATASELQTRLTSNSVTSQQLPRRRATLTASDLDGERAKGSIRGPLHGIPIIVKENIATVPALGLPTTCGSLALVGSKPRQNAAIIERLIAAGVIILGKANLSKPGGSSSGSAVAVAAGFSPISIGTETMGSLIMPSDRSALYTIKPTLKIVPQEGIIPVTPEADSAGPMTKSVLDLANLLDAIADPRKTTITEGGYKSAVTGKWGDIRIGVLEPENWLFPTKIVKYEKQASEQMFREWKAAYKKLASVVKVMKPVTLLSVDESTDHGKSDIWDAFQYLASIDDSKVKTLEELVKFNEDHAEQELPPSADNQAGFIRALSAKMPEEEYYKLINTARDRSGKQGIDKVLEENEVDIIMGPSDGPLFCISGTAGYPVASLPLGYLDFNGRPFGLQKALIQAQSAWEATFPARQPPPLDEIVR
ncbi:amidase family protein [Lasiosphaeria miniovina]|uniref:Amidase family protein n=1 Tax=Lasiosphaeria miniovina TaxID=1954250 RepID=A0AA40AKT5_9PEZI|nr:amidase family protein [Lasiosphaeria miniovina]KAK0717600.1 amidase family protein [Lasiosphaeria miniovina]